MQKTLCHDSKFLIIIASKCQLSACHGIESSGKTRCSSWRKGLFVVYNKYLQILRGIFYQSSASLYFLTAIFGCSSGNKLYASECHCKYLNTFFTFPILIPILKTSSLTGMNLTSFSCLQKFLIIWIWFQ